MRPVPEGVTRYASLSRTNVSTTGLRLPLQPVTHQRKYYRTALLSQPATHRSKCDWTDYSAMRDRYCVTRHLPRRQPTRRADATSTRRTRSPVAETPPSSSFAIASQRSRLQRPLRQFFPSSAYIHFLPHDAVGRRASKTSSSLNAQFTPSSSGLSPPSLQGCLSAEPVRGPGHSSLLSMARHYARHALGETNHVDSTFANISPSLPGPPSSPGFHPLQSSPSGVGDMQALEDGARLLTRDAAATQRWACNRARGSFPTKGCGKGRAPGSEDTRQSWRTFTFVCPRPGCVALVNRARALQHARRAGRRSVIAGDGCASASCSADFRPARFARAQRWVASELVAGKRSLVRPPAATDARDIWLLPFTAEHVAASSALSALSTPRHHKGGGERPAR